MTCAKCNKSVQSIYRFNTIGELPAIWVCWECLPEDKNGLVDVKELTDCLTQEKRK